MVISKFIIGFSKAIIIFMLLIPTVSAFNAPGSRGYGQISIKDCYADSKLAGGFEGKNACDQDSPTPDGTSFASANTVAPHWIIFNLTIPGVIHHITIVWFNNAAGFIWNLDLMKYNGDGNWITIQTFKNSTGESNTIQIYITGSDILVTQFRVYQSAGSLLEMYDMYAFGTQTTPAISDINILTMASFIFVFAFTFTLGKMKHPLFFAFSGVIGLSFAYTLYTLITSLIISGIIAGVSVILITYSFIQKIKKEE